MHHGNNNMRGRGIKAQPGLIITMMGICSQAIVALIMQHPGNLGMAIVMDIQEVWAIVEVLHLPLGMSIVRMTTIQVDIDQFGECKGTIEADDSISFKSNNSLIDAIALPGP